MTTAPRWQRAFVIAACAVIAGAFAYVACDWGQWPRLAYLPTRAELTFARPPGAIAMPYFGIVAWGVGGTLVGAIAGAGICAAAPRAWSERALQLVGGWAVLALVLAGGYYTWGAWPW